MKVLTVFLISIFCFATPCFAQEEYTAFDLYLGDDFKGLVPVFYSDTNAKIETPVDALKVAGLDEKDQDLIELVSGVIPLERNNTDIGKVIINPKIFRIILIPDKKYLKVKDRDFKGYLSSTSDGASFRTDVQYLHFDTYNAGQVDQYRLLGDASAGRAWLHADADFVSSSTYNNRINETSLNFIQGRFINSAGFLQSSGRQLTPSASIAGITLRTEPLLLVGSDELRGSIFQLYVPSRSRVEFYRNGILIDTQVLQSGYQEVDTSRFPQGSYYVDTVITGLGGVSRERRFFAKSGFLTTRGAPQFKLDLGELRQNNELLDIPYYQASGEFRIINPLQLNLSSFGTDEKQTGVAGFNFVYNNVLVTGAVSTASNGKKGVAFGGGGSIYGFSLSGDYEKSEQVSIDELERLDFQNSQQSIEKPFLEERLGSEGRRYTVTLNRWFGNLELRYNYSYISAEPDLDSTDVSNYKSFGPTVRYRFIEDIKNSLYLEVSSQKVNNKDNLYALLSWQHRFSPWSTDVSTGARKTNGKTLPLARGIVQYDTLNQRSGIGVRARTESLYQKTEDSKQQKSGSLDFRAGSNYGGVVVLGNETSSGSTKQTSYGFGANISIAKGSKGGLATGPAGLGQSLLIVELENVDNEALTDILIDGQAINKIKGSGRFILGVSPYQKFKVRIKPSEESPLTRYDSSAREISLFPGNVQTEKFKIEKVFLAIGTVVDKNGQALALKRINGLKDYPLTEENGYFQAEIAGGEEIEIESSPGNICKFKLPKVKKSEYFHDFGKIVCEEKNPSK